MQKDQKDVLSSAIDIKPTWLLRASALNTVDMITISVKHTGSDTRHVLSDSADVPNETQIFLLILETATLPPLCPLESNNSEMDY